MSYAKFDETKNWIPASRTGMTRRKSTGITLNDSPYFSIKRDEENHL
ncbi:hypothetical protein [Wolbachia pipientis]|nr:hypothetical protein [Wolbachia pipientis]